MAGEDSSAKSDTLSTLRHDIKNQLSNIVLAVSQLEFDLPEINDDQKFCIDTITESCKRINAILSQN